MKKYQFLLILFTIASNLFSAQIKWLSIDEALEIQKTNPRPLYLLFVKDDCVNCNKIEDNLSHPIIQQYLNENFYPVKYNSNQSKNFNFQEVKFKSSKNSEGVSFEDFLHISSFPTQMFIDEDLTVLSVINGLSSARNLEPYFNLFQNKDYKKMLNKLDIDSFRNNFKHKIKKD